MYKVYPIRKEILSTIEVIILISLSSLVIHSYTSCSNGEKSSTCHPVELLIFMTELYGCLFGNKIILRLFMIYHRNGIVSETIEKTGLQLFVDFCVGIIIFVGFCFIIYYCTECHTNTYHTICYPEEFANYYLNVLGFCLCYGIVKGLYTAAYNN